MSGAPEPIALEVYVQILAECLVRGGSTDVAGVLGRLNVTAEQFRHAEEHWTTELAQCLPKRKGVLAMQFATAFAEHRRRAGLIDPMGREAAPAFSAAAAAAPVAAVPSYLLEGAGAPKPPGSVHPFATLAAAPAPAPPAPALVAAQPADFFDQTQSMQAPTPGPALPFTPSAAASAIATPPASRPGLRIDTGTAAIFDDPASPATPWSETGLPMSLEAYASLSVELAQKGVVPGTVIVRYGFKTSDEYRQADHAMRVAIQRNAGLRAQYQMLVMRLSANAQR